MRVVCAWCGVEIEPGPPHPVSHGICDECSDKLLEEAPPLAPLGLSLGSRSFRPGPTSQAKGGHERGRAALPGEEISPTPTGPAARRAPPPV